MKKIHKLTFPALLAAVFTMAGIFIFMHRSAPSEATTDRETNASRSVANSNKQTTSAQKEPLSISGQANGGDGGSSAKKVSANKPIALILNSEKSLVADIEGTQGVDVRASASLMAGKKFDDFMKRLSLESESAPLARDITDLYTRSADEANSNVDNVVDINVACGMVVCGISATAPTKDAFEAWYKAFLENQSAPPQAAGRYDKTIEDGSVEYRIIFSTDPERKGVMMPPQ
jgi:hypothetical protein